MPSKPNIVFMLADNVGWGDLSVYGGLVPGRWQRNRAATMTRPVLGVLAVWGMNGVDLVAFFDTGVFDRPSRTSGLRKFSHRARPNTLIR
jgi:arylsulfatase A-like enzyme